MSDKRIQANPTNENARGDITKTVLGNKEALNVAGIPCIIRSETIGSTIYVGYAATGSSESSASWLIERFVVSGVDVSSGLAGGEMLMDKVWDDRASYSYS